MPYDHKSIEKKWPERWEEAGIFHAKEDPDREKFYCLIEFPYPSGAGLHIGHPRSYVAMDVIARQKRMAGKNVLYPIGWDAFGLPTENFAIKMGRKPQDVTAENIATFKRQLKSLGLSFDWSREINTTDPAYYKWTQWMFLQFFKNDLAYKAKIPINWCLSCKIGLANEEVVDGRCERCGGPVEQREKEQWMIAITKYAERLLEDLKTVDYLPKIKKQQEDWIGRSEGAEVKFEIPAYASAEGGSAPGGEASAGRRNPKSEITVFTTRPDTLFGATFMVLAPEHELVDKITTAEQIVAVQEYKRAAAAKTDIERGDVEKEKTGVFTGAYAVNPVNGEQIPIWVADYVLMGYGTGAIMAVPAHDERDWDFAKKFNLPIKPVVIKKQEQGRSFVMGVDEEELKNLGITIVKKTDNGFFEVLIPFERIDEYREFIRNKMQAGFWNEFSTPTGFDFIFKHKDGRLEEMSLNDETNDLIDHYGMTFNGDEPNEQPKNVYSWLAENEFYKDILIHTEEGTAINSGEFDGLATAEFKKKITAWLEEKGLGKAAVNFHLRDWVFSRQRYWGEPIPLVFCEKCASTGRAPGGWVPVPENELPLVLPEVEHYEPTDTGESPLAAISDWVNTTCPECGAPAKRETDTMPNWAGSSWYFLRYCDPHNDKMFASPEALKYWMPVDWYNGGMEHTTLHLLYSRFWNKFLCDQGFVPVSEPYAKRTSHGLILAHDGQKMSKSKGNVVNPDEIVGEYGADTLRLYEMFMGPFGEAIPWNPRGVVGVRRFLEKVWSLREKVGDADDPALTRLFHKTVKHVTEDIEALKMNTAVAHLMTMTNALCDAEVAPRDIVEGFFRLLCPLAPHLANEMWEAIGNEGFVESKDWPAFDPELARDELATVAIQVNGKLRGTMDIAPDLSEADAKDRAVAVENVAKHLEGREVVKVIYVPGRLINLVVK